MFASKTETWALLQSVAKLLENHCRVFARLPQLFVVNPGIDNPYDRRLRHTFCKRPAQHHRGHSTLMLPRGYEMQIKKRRPLEVRRRPWWGDAVYLITLGNLE